MWVNKELSLPGSVTRVVRSMKMSMPERDVARVTRKILTIGGCFNTKEYEQNELLYVPYIVIRNGDCLNVNETLSSTIFCILHFSATISIFHVTVTLGSYKKSIANCKNDGSLERHILWNKKIVKAKEIDGPSLGHSLL